MLKTIVIAKVLHSALLLLFAVAVVGFLSFANSYGAFLAAVTTLIAWGAFKKRRWAYFAAAAWGLACYQLAKQGYEFQAIKHYVMVLGVVIIPVALFLHETLGKPQNADAQKSVTNAANGRDLPP
jgi:uncharacterized membrane protein YhfC